MIYRHTIWVEHEDGDEAAQELSQAMSALAGDNLMMYTCVPEDGEGGDATDPTDQGAGQPPA